MREMLLIFIGTNWNFEMLISGRGPFVTCTLPFSLGPLPINARKIYCWENYINTTAIWKKYGLLMREMLIKIWKEKKIVGTNWNFKMVISGRDPLVTCTLPLSLGPLSIRDPGPRIFLFFRSRILLWNNIKRLNIHEASLRFAGSGALSSNPLNLWYMYVYSKVHFHNLPMNKFSYLTFTLCWKYVLYRTFFTNYQSSNSHVAP